MIQPFILPLPILTSVSDIFPVLFRVGIIQSPFDLTCSHLLRRLLSTGTPIFVRFLRKKLNLVKDQNSSRIIRYLRVFLLCPQNSRLLDNIYLIVSWMWSVSTMNWMTSLRFNFRTLVAHLMRNLTVSTLFWIRQLKQMISNFVICNLPLKL